MNFINCGTFRLMTEVCTHRPMNLKEEELKIFPKLLIAIVCCGGLKREREEERGEGL